MINERHLDFRAFYATHKVNLGLLIAFLLPLRLSWALCAVVPTLLLFLLARGSQIFDEFRTLPRFAKLYLSFLLWTFIGSFFGLNPLRSLWGSLGLMNYSLLLLFYRDVFRSTGPVKPLAALFMGQSVSSIHSILNAAYPTFQPYLFVGKVSESGQLAISVPLALGFLCYLNFQLLRSSSPAPNGLLIFSDIFNLSRRKVCFMLLTLSAAACALASSFTDSREIILLAAVSFGITLLISINYVRGLLNKHGLNAAGVAHLVSNIMLPLCLVALLVNLKRGPWAGVSVGFLLIIFMYSKRLLAPMLAVAALVFLTVSPVRERLEQSAQHFFIHGGRKAIWDIGIELAASYPLGIGWENSPVLRDFSTEIPSQLRHFHSNLLNITVETGWIGLILFLFFLQELILSAWRINSSKEAAILGKALASAIISWQIAGLVEYNFGDTEVLLMSMIIMGLTAALLAPQEQSVQIATRELTPQNTNISAQPAA